MSSQIYLTKTEFARNNEQLRRMIRDTINRNMKKSKISKTRQAKKQKTRKPKKSPLKRKKEPLSANKKVVHFVTKGK
jgi:hypothetical protein